MIRRATKARSSCHICRMITYNVTITGSLGFQVSVLGPYPSDAHLIGDFGSSQEAEAFADRMREIDAGRADVRLCRSMVHDSDGRWTTPEPMI